MAHVNINFQQEADKLSRFIEKFTAPRLKRGVDAVAALKYKDQMTKITNLSLSSFTVELDDVAAFDEELVHNIEGNTKRYTTMLYSIIDAALPPSQKQVNDDSNPLEVIMFQRRQRDQAQQAQLEQMDQDAAAIPNAERRETKFPPALTRNYNIHFIPRIKVKPMSVRDIGSDSVGHLVKLRGMVTRVTNVKPMAVVMAYSCDKCGNEVFQEVASHSWTPASVCPSESCKKNATRGVLHMQTRASKFNSFQEVKIQELPDQVPMGHIPRSMTVYLYDDLTRSCNPGDTVYVSGIFLPIPFTGYKAVRAGLITDTYIEAHHVEQLKKQYNQMLITPEIQSRIDALAEDRDLYNKLARSIAPEIYGHDDVKKALLLLLVGGTTKDTGDGMKVRGDLNMCLMGDPGVAKSQLMKYISKTAPRGVYTTGRGSSGVGLTASVAKDPVTDEMVLEGGALVLADNGICCIDEFDKMDENDRTAIHEVMEQQTISISKAGITTTLNARTSILAAANPQYGRYNPNIKPTDNINLPAALLSRFDLLFLLLDKPSLDDDLRLAQHVTHVHMHLRHPQYENVADVIDLSVMRHYIAIARTHNPTVPAEVGDYVVNAYVHMRGKVDETADFQYTCARTLLSVIRLSSALARLRFSDLVDIGDVDEALRLIDVSKASLMDSDKVVYRDANSSILEIIKDMSKLSDGRMQRSIKLSDIRDRVISKGYSAADLDVCIASYQAESLWNLSTDSNTLTFLSVDDTDFAPFDEDDEEEKDEDL